MGPLRSRFQHWGSERRLRRHLRRELAALHIDTPTDLGEVCHKLGQSRGKPVRPVAYPFEVPGPFGLWINTPSADYILYQQRTTKPHQQHIIAHELGHLLANHQSDEDDDAVWAELMPDIPPDRIRRLLRRTAYDTVQEREAETAATMLLESAAVMEYLNLPAKSARAQRAQRTLATRQGWL